MKIKKTQFIKSSTSLEECPKGDFPEFVFLEDRMWVNQL